MPTTSPESNGANNNFHVRSYRFDPVLLAHLSGPRLSAPQPTRPPPLYLLTVFLLIPRSSPLPLFTRSPHKLRTAMDPTMAHTTATCSHLKSQRANKLSSDWCEGGAKGHQCISRPECGWICRNHNRGVTSMWEKEGWRLVHSRAMQCLLFPSARGIKLRYPCSPVSFGHVGHCPTLPRERCRIGISSPVRSQHQARCLPV